MLTLAVLVPALASVAFVGFYGLRQTQAGANAVYNDNLQTIGLSNSLRDNIDQAEETALRLIPTVDSARIARLNGALDALEITVDGQIELLRQAHAGDPAAERAQVETIASAWSTFDGLRRSGALDRVGFDRAAVLRGQRAAESVSGIFARIAAVTGAESRLEVSQAAASHLRAATAYHRSVLLLLGIVALAIGGGRSACSC